MCLYDRSTCKILYLFPAQLFVCTCTHKQMQTQYVHLLHWGPCHTQNWGIHDFDISIRQASVSSHTQIAEYLTLSTAYWRLNSKYDPARPVRRTLEISPQKTKNSVYLCLIQGLLFCFFVTNIHSIWKISQTHWQIIHDPDKSVLVINADVRKTDPCKGCEWKCIFSYGSNKRLPYLKVWLVHFCAVFSRTSGNSLLRVIGGYQLIWFAEG